LLIKSTKVLKNQWAPPCFFSKGSHYTDKVYYDHAQFPRSISRWYGSSTVVSVVMVERT